MQAVSDAHSARPTTALAVSAKTTVAAGDAVEDEAATAAVEGMPPEAIRPRQEAKGAPTAQSGEAATTDTQRKMIAKGTKNPSR